MKRLGAALRSIGHTWGTGAALLLRVFGSVILALFTAALLIAAASAVSPSVDWAFWALITAFLWLPLAVAWIARSLRDIGFEQLAFPLLLGGWICLVVVYDIHSMAVVLLGMALIGCTGFASDWAIERLWHDEPERKLAIGMAIMVSTIVFFVAVEPISLLPAAPSDAFSVRLAALALSYAAITGGALLSLTLVASGSRQAIQRWRYYRSIGR